MGEFLQAAQDLLQQMVDSWDAPTIVVAHRLRDLAIVLDELSLATECVLAGNCALSFFTVIAPWSLKLQLEQAETLALIAKLSSYEPHARTLFLQAISLCEQVVAKDGSPSKKVSLLGILDRAGGWSVEHPDLGMQWLGQAIRIMTTELPTSMVDDYTRSRIYLHYGSRLSRLGRFSEAIDAAEKAVSLRRALSGKDPVRGKEALSQALGNLGNRLRMLRKYEASAAAFEEALELDRSCVFQDPKSIFEHMKRLMNYGRTLICINQVSRAAELDQQAVMRCRELVQMDAKYCTDLCSALRLYGEDCHRLGSHSETILAFGESISLARDLIERGSTKAQTYLTRSLHDMANSLHVLGCKSEAEAAATESLQRNGGKPHDTCNATRMWLECFVCRRIPILDTAVLSLSGLDQFRPSSTILRADESRLTTTTSVLNPVDHSVTGGMSRLDPSRGAALPVMQGGGILVSSSKKNRVSKLFEKIFR
jgi:tetratricopeptide (TPR) repeat protein